MQILLLAIPAYILIAAELILLHFFPATHTLIYTHALFLLIVTCLWEKPAKWWENFSSGTVSSMFFFANYAVYMGFNVVMVIYLLIHFHVSISIH